jgi:hypothetical protein
MARHYSDLHILPLDAFYVIMHDFPREGDAIRKIAMGILDNYNVLSDSNKLDLIKHHSSRSVGANYC